MNVPIPDSWLRSKKLISEQGQSLIEVVAGVAMAMVVVSALIGLGVTSLRQSNAAKNKERATRLANNFIEQVRAYRDSNGLGALPAVDEACGLVAGLDLYAGGVDGSGDPLCGWSAYDSVFDYVISVAPSPAGPTVAARLVTARVRFFSSSREEIVSSSSIFSDWVGT